MNQIQKYENALQAVQKEDSLIEAFLPMQEKLYIFAPAEIQNWKDEKKEQFLRKTMMVIAHDEKLTPCFESAEGKMSILEAVQKSCSTGLEIGGKHAYLIPQKENGKTKARYSIKASGYVALLAGGDRPIFKDIKWGLVYEKDECSIDQGTGEVSHPVSVSSDRGELIGCWVQIIKKTGEKDAKYFPMKKVNQWKAFSKMPGGAWSKWTDEMTEQACIRHACDKYEQARDLLVNAFYSDDMTAQAEEKTNTEILNETLAEEEPIIKEELDKSKDQDDTF